LGGLCGVFAIRNAEGNDSGNFLPTFESGKMRLLGYIIYILALLCIFILHCFVAAIAGIRSYVMVKIISKKIERR